MTTLPRFDQPANYRITVQGHLGDEWVDYLRGMTIDNLADKETPIATVTGRLPDQAALIGLLNTLYDAHVTVLAVESLGIAEDALDLFGFPEALQ
jgi:hypothetical protein